MESSLETVRPVSPVAPYLGGKRNLASRICQIIENVPHKYYAEPFVGMGGVFLRRRSRPRAEAINDISRDVATLFRVLQRHYVAFMDMLKWQISSRAEFMRLVNTNPETLTDLERAARFLYLQRTAFGGKVKGRNFGVDARSPARFDVTKLHSLLEEVHERLAGVTIECLPYGDFLSRYDKPETLFYLDPPYWNCETDYGVGVFAPDDFARLADTLRGLQGSFILSINDVPEIREIFSAFDISEVQTTYTIATATKGQGKAVGELLITNAGLVCR